MILSNLNTWQLLDPAGSQPDPDIEVTYQKNYYVYQLKVFWDENFKYDIKIKFWTLGSPWILLKARYRGHIKKWSCISIKGFMG